MAATVTPSFVSPPTISKPSLFAFLVRSSAATGLMEVNIYRVKYRAVLWDKAKAPRLEGRILEGNPRYSL
jgi:hypothetical protein